MKLVFLASFFLVAAQDTTNAPGTTDAPGTDASVTESATISCDGYGNMTYTYTHGRTDELAQFESVNPCTDDDVGEQTPTVTTTGAAGGWIHIFEIPKSCADDEGNVSMNFYYSSFGADHSPPVLTDSSTATFTCPLPDPVYEVEYTFDSVTFDPSEDSEAEGVVDFEVTLSRVDDSWAEATDEVKVGGPVYFKLEPSNNNFNFDLGHCKLVQDGTENEFTFLDMYNADHCSEVHDDFGVDVSKHEVDGKQIYYFNFDMFRFETTTGIYKLKCSVFPCFFDADATTDNYCKSQDDASMVCDLD